MSKDDRDEDLVRRLADLLDEKDLTEIEFTTGRTSVRVSRQPPPAAMPAATAPVAAVPQAPGAPAEASSAPAADASHPGAVTSPMVGTVYLQPDPSSPPYVRPGDEVQQGQTLLLIEAMKTFNEIRAPKGGTVAQVMVENGTPVEYGDVMMVIE